MFTVTLKNGSELQELLFSGLSLLTGQDNTYDLHSLNIFCVPGTLLRVLFSLTHLILMTILYGSFFPLSLLYREEN